MLNKIPGYQYTKTGSFQSKTDKNIKNAKMKTKK